MACLMKICITKKLLIYMAEVTTGIVHCFVYENK